MTRKNLYKLTVSALCVATAFVLPYLTGQIPTIGNALCPMHLPSLLCGFLCGPLWGLAVGAISPLLRSLAVGMPSFFPRAVAMAFELAAYGFLSGLLYRIFPKKTGYLYLSLVLSMLGGRIVWGIVSLVLVVGIDGGNFPFAYFLSEAFTKALPGIIVQITVIPAVILILKKAKLTPDTAVKR